MSERFTDRARKVMQLANQEALRFHHEYIGTEHILLGLVKEDAGVAANVLKNLDVELRRVRREVVQIVQPGADRVTIGKLPQTPRAKKVIEFSLEEARGLNHDYVGTEHLLLGLLRDVEGVGAQVLMNFGLTAENVREEILNLLGPTTLLTTARRFSETVLQKLPAEERVVVLDLPAAVLRAAEELDAEIARLTQEKEAAVAEHDFERAVLHRDLADKLKRRKTVVLRDWAANRVIHASWLSWNGGATTRIAQVIHDEQRWEDLPVLADALEEAGCTDREILSHCRQPGEHADRCWVLDLLLGKV